MGLFEIQTDVKHQISNYHVDECTVVDLNYYSMEEMMEIDLISVISDWYLMMNRQILLWYLMKELSGIDQ